MAKTCIQCGKKIGFFQKPVDEIYCSMECSATAQREIAETERKATQLRAEQERTQAAQAEHDAARKAEANARAERRASCPKCGHGWQVAEQSDGRALGSCKHCGFSASFRDVDTCPSCSGPTLVIESDSTARCPRCKYRRG